MDRVWKYGGASIITVAGWILWCTFTHRNSFVPTVNVVALLIGALAFDVWRNPAGRIGDWALERPSPRRIFCLCGSIRRCPLLVQSGHALVHRECPRSGVNRTSEITCRSRQTPRAHPPEWSQRADRFRDRGAIRRFPHNKPSYPGSNYTKIKARIP